MPAGVPAGPGSDDEKAMNEEPEVAIEGDCGSAAPGFGRRLVFAPALRRGRP